MDRLITFVSIFVLFSKGVVWCQTSMPQDCNSSLTSSLSDSSYSASSVYSTTYAPSQGRINSFQAWIPQNYTKISLANPEYLQIDLGETRTLTAIITEGYSGRYVKQFKLLLSVDGKSFDPYQGPKGDKVFKTNSITATMQYLRPSSARHIRFVPTEFVSGIALKVDVYGCNEKPEVKGPTIADLKVTSIEQTAVTFTWRVVGSYDRQRSTYQGAGEEVQHKTLPNNGRSTFAETVKGLKPCKNYKMTVTVFKGSLESKKSFNVTTSPIALKSPIITSATSPEPFEAHLQWEMPSKQGESCSWNITSFVIEYVTDEPSPVRRSLNAPAHYTVKVAKLKAWTTYKFSVYAIAGPSKSARSNEKDVLILGIAPSQPVKVTSVQPGSDSFTVSWVNPPRATVNGDITGFGVLYRKKDTKDWKHTYATAMTQSKTVSSLTSGISYEVKVLLFNHKYNISSDIKEVFVGRKKPVYSKELQDGFKVASGSPNVVAFDWKIPSGLNAETPEVIMAEIWKLGDNTIIKKNMSVSATRSEKWITNLAPFRIYAGKINLVTKRGVYYTNRSLVMVKGSSQSDVVKIGSIESKQRGTVQLTVKLPRQYVANGLASIVEVRYNLLGARWANRQTFNQNAGSATHIVKNLNFWKTYYFQIVVKIFITNKKTSEFRSSIASILVIGDSPGKPPTNVAATVLSPTSVSVTWRHIPKEYIYGELDGYVIFYSHGSTQSPRTKRVGKDTSSAILENLMPETAYSIQVAGWNGTGYGPLSQIVMATSKKDPQPPVIQSVTALSARKISVRWTQPDDPSNIVNNFTIFVNLDGREITMQKYSRSDFDKRFPRLFRTSIQGLNPSSTYKIYIIASKLRNGITKTSDSSNSMEVSTPKDPAPPTPVLLTAMSLTSTVIEVRWKSQIDRSFLTENYTVCAVDKNGKKIRKSFGATRSPADTRNERTYDLKVRGLKPFTRYSVYVFASKRSDGKILVSPDSNKVDAETKEAAPSAPRNFDYTAKDDNHYVFTWKAPKKRNGVIRKYHFTIYDIEAGRQLANADKLISGENTSWEVKGMLRPYRQYRATLKAVTIAAGDLAQKTFTTKEGFPTAPLDVKATYNGTHIIITWKTPKRKNGKILRYKIQFSEKKPGSKKTSGGNAYQASPQLRKFAVKDLTYRSRYTIKISAETSRGPGPDSKPANVFIDPNKMPRPDAPPQPEVVPSKVRSTTMVVKLKPLLKMTYSVSMSAYQIIVQKLNGGSITKRAVDILPKDISNHSSAAKNRKIFYIAAQFKPADLPNEFVVGDGKMYDGYYNAPLNPETVYKVHVRAVGTDEQGNPVYGTASSVTLPATAPRKGNPKAKGGGIPLPIVAGIAGALLLLIILVAIIILYLRTGSGRRLRNSKKKKEPYELELAKMRTTIDPDEQRPVSLTGDFPLHPDHPPITLANYSKHVAKLHRSDNNGFRAEYNQLEMGKEFSWEMAHLPENKPKNRFANIVAYDHARVILTKQHGRPGSDYINASYIDGFMKPNAYVASQGPLPATFNDFWRMIWMLRSSVIVMLTNLEEKNKLKCHKYWPDDCTEYSEIIVTQIRKEVYADYIIRTFLLEKSDSPETREVKHFHFTVWPDHGVPKYATAILAFRRRVRSYNRPDTGPTLVHCSAGVGRTGTFIALDAMLDRMSGQGDVDVFNFIAAMRTRRIAMVQTEEQYIFIHDAILESIQCGNTEINATDLRIMINKLEQVSMESKMTGFEREWKILNNVSPIPSKSASKTLHENMMKNRTQNACVLPSDMSLVRLLTIEDDEATAYINAVYVDGYKQRNAYILTQAPMKNTVMDFWRMLCEHKSASVVLLCSLDEGDDFVKFWPEMHIREYDMITVECLSKARGSDEASLRSVTRRGEIDLVIRQFRVEDTRFPEYPMMVKLFQYVGWSETKVPGNCNSVIQLINQLERWQQQSGNGPITIVCRFEPYVRLYKDKPWVVGRRSIYRKKEDVSTHLPLAFYFYCPEDEDDGLGRSGTFAALNAVLERVKMESMVDVFQAIKAMRIQRAHLVKTLEQYKFIYNAVEEYLTAFDDYANFK